MRAGAGSFRALRAPDDAQTIPRNDDDKILPRGPAGEYTSLYS